MDDNDFPDDRQHSPWAIWRLSHRVWVVVGLLCVLGWVIILCL